MRNGSARLWPPATGQPSSSCARAMSPCGECWSAANRPSMQRTLWRTGSGRAAKKRSWCAWTISRWPLGSSCSFDELELRSFFVRESARAIDVSPGREPWENVPTRCEPSERAKDARAPARNLPLPAGAEIPACRAPQLSLCAIISRPSWTQFGNSKHLWLTFSFEPADHVENAHA
jgi:hypothetical protein